jgi:hypothetical protein
MSATPVLDSEPLDRRRPLDDLVVDPAFQIRGGLLNKHVVKRYADAMYTGQLFPAILAMRVQGRLVLIDGFHRYAAAKECGRLHELEVEAIGDGTAAEARWRAFAANSQHGLPLKSREVREGFKAYIRAKQNVTPSGKLKSYRDIARDLGVGHTTIRHWMQRFFRAIFARMSHPSEGPFSPGEGGSLFPTSEVIPMSSSDFVRQAQTVAATHADDADENWRLLQTLEAFLAELRRRPLAAPEF